MDTEPTVFIVDDDQGVREAVTLLMDSIGLAAEGYAGAQEYLDAFDPRRPGCLVLDVRMRGMSGLELQQRLAAEPLHPPIVIITGHGDVPMAVRAVQAGAVDFIEKPFKDQVLLDAVHRALQRDAQARGQAMRLAEIQERMGRLTPREREILDLIVAGRRNKVIALDLGISQSTVEAHRAKVMEKLEARSLSDLMRIVLLSCRGVGRASARRDTGALRKTPMPPATSDHCRHPGPQNAPHTGRLEQYGLSAVELAGRTTQQAGMSGRLLMGRPTGRPSRPGRRGRRQGAERPGCWLGRLRRTRARIRAVFR